MNGKYTFSMIKPDALKNGFQGLILDQIIKAGFKISAMKLLRLSQQQAQSFYEIHQGKPFYESLTQFMSSGNIIALMLEKENAVEDFRKLIGATNPAQAEQGTIRQLYASSLSENAIHGSDSDENAEKEINFFFSVLERF